MAKNMICEKAAECSLKRRLEGRAQCPETKVHHQNSGCSIRCNYGDYPGVLCKEVKDDADCNM